MPYVGQLSNDRALKGGFHGKRISDHWFGSDYLCLVNTIILLRRKKNICIEHEICGYLRGRVPSFGNRCITKRQHFDLDFKFGGRSPCIPCGLLCKESEKISPLVGKTPTHEISKHSLDLCACPISLHRHG